jgi:hypothetical protein
MRQPGIKFITGNVAKTFFKHVCWSTFDEIVLALCRIFEKNGQNSRGNININTFLQLLLSNISLITPIPFNKDEFTEGKIEEDISKITSYNIQLESLFRLRNKIVGHSDINYILNRRLQEQDIKQVKKAIQPLIHLAEDIIGRYLLILRGENIPSTLILNKDLLKLINSIDETKLERRKKWQNDIETK